MSGWSHSHKRLNCKYDNFFLPPPFGRDHSKSFISFHYGMKQLIWMFDLQNCDYNNKT